MIIGIDGDQWYACCGKGLGDLYSKYAFRDTCREAIEAFHRSWPDLCDKERGLTKHHAYLDMTVAEYRAAEKIIEEDEEEERAANGQFGVGA